MFSKCKKTFGIGDQPSHSEPPKNGKEAHQRLRELGYAFNMLGQLRQIDQKTGEPGDKKYEYKVSYSETKNQKHYEIIGETIPEIVYELLEQNGLKRLYIPLDATPELQSFIYIKPEKIERSKKLLVLMHGSGPVRAGQWARSLIMNESLEHGTQVPYVRMAQTLGYDVIITNANDNYRFKGTKRFELPKIGTGATHCEYVLKNIIMTSNPESVAFVAHSYGGALIIHLLNKYYEFFMDNVFAIAFTDSSHGYIDDANREFIDNRTLNWAAREEPLDTVLDYKPTDLPRVSAGHDRHEYSSYMARDSVFQWLEKKYTEFMENKAKTDSKEQNLIT